MDYTFSKKMQSLKPSAIREIFKSLQDPSIISFAAGNPAPESFPVEELAPISEEIYEKRAAEALQYGITEGYTPLREQVKERLAEKFGVDTASNEIIITSGGQQAIDLFCKVMCDEGDTVICEDPSFIGALNAFRAQGTVLKGVELKDGGIDSDKLEQLLKSDKRVKFIYLIPTFQNPTGITASEKNRRDVLALAEKYGVLILEDNPYGELRFAGEEVPCYKSMDKNGRVVYCGSFSKVLSAGMRVGFVCAPAQIISKMVVVKQVNDVHTNLYFQMLTSEYIKRYGLDGHIEKIRSLYRVKCEAMLSEMDGQVKGHAQYTRPEGGIFMWCTLHQKIDMMEFVKKAVERKVAVVPGSAFLADQNGVSNSFRLNYSMPSLEQIKKGVAVLGDILRDYA